MYMDKYSGRNILASNFKRSLLSFLDNGTHYLVGYIPVLLEKLKLLIQVVEKLPNFRFYASSLLILYDGHTFESSNQIDVRMIDFANCITNADDLEFFETVNCPPTTSGPDMGYILGLKSLIRSFEEIHKELSISDTGHVLKEKISKSLRATAEVGLLDLMGQLDVSEPGGTSPLLPRKLDVVEPDDDLTQLMM